MIFQGSDAGASFLPDTFLALLVRAIKRLAILRNSELLGKRLIGNYASMFLLKGHFILPLILIYLQSYKNLICYVRQS